LALIWKVAGTVSQIGGAKREQRTRGGMNYAFITARTRRGRKKNCVVGGKNRKEGAVRKRQSMKRP